MKERGTHIFYRNRKIADDVYRKSDECKNLKAHILKRKEAITILQKNLLAYFNAEIVIGFIRHAVTHRKLTEFLANRLPNPLFYVIYRKRNDKTARNYEFEGLYDSTEMETAPSNVLLNGPQSYNLLSCQSE